MSKNSGERAGPNETLLRVRFFIGSSSTSCEVLTLADTDHFEEEVSRGRLREEVEGEGEVAGVSSTSRMDPREVEREEDVRER